MVNTDYVSQNMFDTNGHTANKYYYRIVGNRDSKIWNYRTKAMTLGVEWLDAACVLVEIGSTGVFPVTIFGELPAGTYDIIIYVQAGDNPADTDNVEEQWTETKGDIFGF